MATSTRPGDVLAGRYRLIDLLSESGGGRFWRAHDNVLERFVALHVIPEHDARAPALLEAARASATVLDSRILRVLDAEIEDGLCFVVNEWGTGISLDILVTHAGPLSPRRAAWLVADVAGAIAKAHAAGVAHGRLNPENVLIDSYGAVRIIGLCVDAALHGIPAGDVQNDLEDLGGLLYCALTATWPGPSGSIVPAAPREHDVMLSPRQVRAGVPKPLDTLWREFDCDRDHGRRRWRDSDHPDVSSARAIRQGLLDFVGDTAGMPESLASAIPSVNELQPVWLPAVADPMPHDPTGDDLPVVPAAPGPVEGPEQTDQPERPEPRPAAAEAATGTVPARDPELDPETAADGAPEPDARPTPVADLPTEPGMPVFGDDEDVEWLRTRSTPPPPPPPFEDPPERPLFAPDPPDGRPVRRLRPDVAAHAGAGGARGTGANGFWPWEHEAAAPPPDATEEQEPVPGRGWIRLAMAVGAALLLLIAVAIAFNLGRGRTVLGGMPDDEPTDGGSATVDAQPIRGITASDFDPLGTDGGENPDEAPLVLDGDVATAWSTSTYEDQLGPPPGLKTGVGLVLDLAQVRTVAAVDVRVGAGRTRIGLYVLQGEPQVAPTAAPLATETGSGRITLTPRSTAEGRYVVLWLTSLPEVEGGFRAELSEVVVRGG